MPQIDYTCKNAKPWSQLILTATSLLGMKLSNVIRVSELSILQRWSLRGDPEMVSPRGSVSLPWSKAARMLDAFRGSLAQHWANTVWKPSPGTDCNSWHVFCFAINSLSRWRRVAQRRINAGPASATLAQHWSYAGLTPHDAWDTTDGGHGATSRR